MKKILLILGIAAMSAACSNNPEEGIGNSGNGNNNGNKQVKGLSFTAAIETTRTSLEILPDASDVTLGWKCTEHGGQGIGIFALPEAGEAHNNKHHYPEECGESCNFAADGENNAIMLDAGCASADIVAYYPFNGSCADSGAILMEVPDTQIFDGDNPAKMSMVAKATAADVDSPIALTFRNIFSTVVFGLKGYGVTLRSMVIEPVDESALVTPISGSGTLDAAKYDASESYNSTNLFTGDGAPLTLTASTKSITVNFGGEGLTLTNEIAKVPVGMLPFVIPAGGMKLTFTDSEQRVFSKTVWSGKAGTDIASNKMIYQKLDDIDNKHFTPVSSLYLFGSVVAGAVNGWNPDEAAELTPVDGQDGKFRFEGYLKAGEFKFLVNERGYYSNFIMPEQNGTILSESGEGPAVRVPYSSNSVNDKKWSVPNAEAGFYEITVDVNAGTIGYVRTRQIETIRLVGEEAALPGTAWNIPTAPEFTETDGLFVCEAEIGGSDSENCEVKFMVNCTDWGQEDQGLHHIIATTSDQGLRLGARMLKHVEGSIDRKWKFNNANAGHYRITIDPATLDVKFERMLWIWTGEGVGEYIVPSNVYIIGALVDWNISESIELLPAAVQKFEGTFTIPASGSRDFKFFVNKKEFNNNYNFTAAAENTPVANGTFPMRIADSNDHKWQVGEETVCKIEVDVHNMAVTFTKQ